MRLLFLATILLTAFSSPAQFYFKDIIGTNDINRTMKNMLEAKVRSVNAVGYDERGARTNDFNEQQEILYPKHILKLTRRSQQSSSSVYYEFDANTNLISVTDTAGFITSQSRYTYDSEGRLIGISTKIKDSLQDFSSTEVHQWIYNAAGKPEKMWRIVNGTDSSEYRFYTDEAGNIAEEKLYRRNREIDFLYYYYDSKGRITDIVRYDKKLRKLVADQMLEYDDQDNVIQKLTPVSYRNPDYLIWRFQFNEKGLKTREALFNKKKQRTGTIEYQYTFVQ